MLKRAMVILLCMMMLLTGCNNLPGGQGTDQTLGPEGGLPVIWKSQSSYADETVVYAATQYSPKVPAYQVEADLSNIENLHRLDGFSQAQRQKLSNNGFVILEPNPDRAHHYMKMYDIYEENEYKQIPSFITVDVALHIYHKFYNETLKELEREE